MSRHYNTCLSRVDLPAPRKPDMIVSGTRFVVDGLGFCFCGLEVSMRELIWCFC